MSDSDQESFQALSLSALRRPAVLLGVIAALSFLIYLSTLSFEFVWDDQLQVVSNPLILSWKAIPRAFQTNLWFQVLETGSYYRPLFIVWSIFNYALFGLNPWGWHLTNVLLHVIATCLVFALARKLQIEYWTAALAALCFGIHPVHIECVAWVSAASDTLVTIFFVLSFLAFLKAEDPRSSHSLGWKIASFVLFAAALFTKEMAIMFPAIIFLYLWLFRQRPAHGGHWRKLRTTVFTSLPYALLAIAYLFERSHVLHGVAHLNDNHGAWTTLGTLPLVLMEYVRILIFPVGLNGFYYVPYVMGLSLTRLVLPSFGLLILGAGLWFWFERTKDRLIAFCALWVPVCLAPALYLPAFRNGDFVRDRYLYLPSVGFALLIAKVLRTVNERRTLCGVPRVQVGIVGVLSVACIFGVITQQVYWANDGLVFYRGYSLQPQNTKAEMYLAATLNRQGEPAKALPLLQDAISHDRADAYGHFTLGMVEARLGREDEGREEIMTALRLSPKYYFETSDGLINSGIAFSALHSYLESERYLRRALQMEANSASANYYLSLVLLRTNRPLEAEDHLRKALSIDANGQDFRWALGLARQMQGDVAGAAQLYHQELRFHPNSRNAQLSLTSLDLKSR